MATKGNDRPIRFIYDSSLFTTTNFAFLPNTYFKNPPTPPDYD